MVVYAGIVPMNSLVDHCLAAAGCRVALPNKHTIDM